MNRPSPSKRKHTIALIGMRGAGKTTVGRELARLLNGTFVDIDERIALETGKTIAQIFQEEGEAGFRRREAAMIEEAVTRRPDVLSVGGGTVLNPENVRRIREIAWVVCLKAPASILWERIGRDSNSGETRPQLTDRSGLDEITVLLREREPIYKKMADVEIETAGCTFEEVARRILDRISGT